MILTQASFNIIRKEILGSLTQSQVDGLNFLVSSMGGAGFSYPEAAYALATVHIETAKTFKPIVEFGKRTYFDKYDTGRLAKALGNTPEKDGDGFLYRGRGYVQITGLSNFKKFSNILGVDLVKNPDAALNQEVAALIMLHGMLMGTFTGVGFRKGRPVSRYNKAQYVRARNIINGTDRATEIANLALKYEKALRS